ncbi:MAG: response regulator [Ferruginibacter sp.]
MKTGIPKYKILLADDDIDDCNSFKESLEELKLSYALTVVHNGEQLMKLLNETGEYPDVIFLDLNMPRKTGFQCLAEIKEDKRTNMIPVVIVSTSLDNYTIERLYEGGAIHFIQKPSDFTQLTSLVYKALKALSFPQSNDGFKEKFVIFP